MRQKAHEEDGTEPAPKIATEEDVGYVIKTQTGRVTDIRVSKADIDKHGITGGCPACKYLMEGKKIGAGIAHNTECRKRIRDLIKESDDVKDWLIGRKRGSKALQSRQKF